MYMRKTKLFIAAVTLSAFLVAVQAQERAAPVASDSINTITSGAPIKKLDKRLGIIPGKKTNWSKIKDLFL